MTWLLLSSEDVLFLWWHFICFLYIGNLATISNWRKLAQVFCFSQEKWYWHSWCWGICRINPLYSALVYILVFVVFYVLHFAWYLLGFQNANSILMVKNRYWRKRITIKLEWQMQREREKRTDLVISLKTMSRMRHTHRYWWSSLQSWWINLKCLDNTMMMFPSDETIFDV